MNEDDFDEKAKKSIQKQLARLAKEEGLLSSNLGQAILSLSYIVAGFLPNDRVLLAIGDTLDDLHEVYRALVRNEGTYLDKAKTLRFFISTEAIPQFVVSLNRNLLRYRIADLELKTPNDEFWYLPTMAEDGTLTLPLAKVMRWAYQLCGVSQTQFHYPGKCAESDELAYQHNLDNAINWTRGANMPSLPALIKNVEVSFRAMAEHGREIPKPIQASILVALILARVSSYISKKIINKYDVHYLRDICAQYRDYSSWIADDVSEFEAELRPVMDAQQSSEEADSIWTRACAQYWGFFYAKVVSTGEALQRLHDECSDQAVREKFIRALTIRYGRFSVFVCIDIALRRGSFSPPDGFTEVLGMGFELKRDPETQWEQIEEYAAQVESHGLQEHLCWMVPWLRAVYYYRREDFCAAMSEYQVAFDNAKYRAGRLQYDLVNQYVEVAAKNDKMRNFRKGIEWAQYLGIQVRWLRNDEPTDEKLDYVYGMLKMARYDLQL